MAYDPVYLLSGLTWWSLVVSRCWLVLQIPNLVLYPNLGNHFPKMESDTMVIMILPHHNDIILSCHYDIISTSTFDAFPHLQEVLFQLIFFCLRSHGSTLPMLVSEFLTPIGAMIFRRVSAAVRTKPFLCR